MIYNNESHIKSVEDVKTFFHHLVDERKVNFHPDDERQYSVFSSEFQSFRLAKEKSATRISSKLLIFHCGPSRA